MFSYSFRQWKSGIQCCIAGETTGTRQAIGYSIAYAQRAHVGCIMAERPSEAYPSLTYTLLAMTCCTTTDEEPRHQGRVGASCCASSGSDSVPEEAQAIKDVVREKYSQVATAGDGCGYSMIGDAYDEVDGYVEEADLGLGCGLPVEYAGLLPGQTVLDLGSGAGLDTFVARRIVGENGKVIGLDFSKAMVARARQNAQGLGYKNVRFVLGDIEKMPLPDDFADVIISNCVLNLVPAKQRAFEEMYRVLRRGGHFAISDVVLCGPLQDSVRQSVEAYVGCVAGAIERDAYLSLIRKSGFTKVQVMTERQIPAAAGALSITVTGVKL